MRRVLKYKFIIMIYVILIFSLTMNVFIFIKDFEKGTYYGCDKVSDIVLRTNIEGKEKIYNRITYKEYSKLKKLNNKLFDYPNKLIKMELYGRTKEILNAKRYNVKKYQLNIFDFYKFSLNRISTNGKMITFNILEVDQYTNISRNNFYKLDIFSQCGYFTQCIIFGIPLFWLSLNITKAFEIYIENDTLNGLEKINKFIKYFTMITLIFLSIGFMFIFIRLIWELNVLYDYNQSTVWIMLSFILLTNLTLLLRKLYLNDLHINRVEG